MTTATLAAPTPVDALNNKKRFAQVLDARESARTAFDKVKAAPRAAREGLMSLFRTLHLDSIAGTIGTTVSRWVSLGWNKAASAYNYVGRILGWRMVGVWALTDTASRNQLARWAGTGYVIASGAVGKIGGWLGKIPFVGGVLQAAVKTPLTMADRTVYRTAGFVSRQIDKHADHWLVRTAHQLSQAGLFWRVVRAFIPKPYRIAFYLAYAFRPAQAAVKVIREDEVTGKIGAQLGRVKDTARAAAAEAGDIVVDRIMDGPNEPRRMHTTQPGVEVMDAIEVATGKRIEISVDIDSRGQKWVTWEGVTYSATDLPDGIELLPVDLVTATARLDAAHKAVAEGEAASLAAAANGEAPPSRAVARALAASGPRKQAVHGKPSKGSRR